jgi:hypothetical protein
MANEIVKSLLAGMVSPFVGFVNFADGMFAVEGMIPIIAGLHEPVVICWPFVIGRLGTVAQKLMKLFPEVKDATWPASWTAWPSFKNPVAITELRRVSEFWASGLSSVAVLVLFEELVLFEPPEALLIEAAELALAAAELVELAFEAAAEEEPASAAPVAPMREAISA